MKIEFSTEDAEKILYDSFCNGGLIELYHSSVSIDWQSQPNSVNYDIAKHRLINMGMENICLEDVYIQILKMGEEIVFTDYEGEELISLKLDKALDYFNSLLDDEKIELAKMLDDDADTDAWDCYNAIQYALYGEVIFG